MYCIGLWFTSVSAHMMTYRKQYPTLFRQYDKAAATSLKSTNRATEYGYYEQVCCLLECLHLLQFVFSFRDRFELSPTSVLFWPYTFLCIGLVNFVRYSPIRNTIINVGVDWIVALEHWDLSSYLSYSWIESVPRWLQLSRWQMIASAEFCDLKGFPRNKI